MQDPIHAVTNQLARRGVWCSVAAGLAMSGISLVGMKYCA
jgi:hypothetical protein